MSYTLEFSQSEKSFRFYLRDGSYLHFDLDEVYVVDELLSLPNVNSYTVPAFGPFYTEEVLGSRTDLENSALIDYISTVPCTSVLCLYNCISQFRDMPMVKLHYLVHSRLEHGYTGSISATSSESDLELVIQYQNCLDFAQTTSSLATLPTVREYLARSGTLNNIPKNYIGSSMETILGILSKNSNPQLLNCKQTPLIVVDSLLNSPDLSINELTRYTPVHPSQYQPILRGDVQAIKTHIWATKPPRQ